MQYLVVVLLIVNFIYIGYKYEDLRLVTSIGIAALIVMVIAVIFVKAYPPKIKPENKCEFITNHVDSIVSLRDGKVSKSSAERLLTAINPEYSDKQNRINWLLGYIYMNPKLDAQVIKTQIQSLCW